MPKIRRTYKYKLYRSKQDKHLYRAIDVAGNMRNHIIALQRRYYQLTGKKISEGDMKSHIEPIFY
jgi:putative transposase